MNRTLLYIILIVITLAAVPAHAQLVNGLAGDGATALQAFVTWLSGPFIRPLLSIGFIIAGIVMMCGRHTFEGIVFAVIGATLAVGAQNLSNLMAGGGG